ncbi:MAG: methylenetetrahydrofolate--tRNA-(uracil(54)-C(5))-methyltransferase (FADH(2)-oxidizing) TrmFO, partial [Bdellovibrionota bacterium]
KSLSPVSAPGMLKREMEMLGSLAIASAKKAAVGAGEALAVDRDIFSAEMTAAIAAQPNIRLRREEVLALPDDPSVLTILATGPLTSSALADSLQKRTGTEHFYFYDAISPVVDAASLNMDIIFAANRYDKKTRTMEGTEVSTEDSSDYLNCPMTMQQYDAFIDLLLRGERVEGKPFEKVKHFEGCMPIEEMADRGRNTPRFGPMKPVGLVDPKTGREAFAAVQLRPENQSKSAYNLVGFQTKLKYGEQTKVFRSIPGLENAEFHRLGSMHRNSFVDAPRVLNLDLSLKEARHVMLAGQITGVEGYMESAAIGIVAGIFAEARLAQKPIPNPPEESAIGALLSHLRNSTNTNYQPMGINFSLFDDIVFTQALAPLREKFKKKLPKDEKRKALGEACAKNGAEYAARFNLS